MFAYIGGLLESETFELSRLHRGSPLTPFSCVRLCWGLLESETFESHETFESFVSALSEDPLNYADKIR